jgi:hypothetical protein
MSEKCDGSQSMGSGLISSDSYCLSGGLPYGASGDWPSSVHTPIWSLSSVESFSGRDTEDAGDATSFEASGIQFSLRECGAEGFTGSPTDQEGSPEADPVSCVVEKPKPA